MATKGTLTETCQCGGTVESDTPGVIQGVKVLGLESRNKRRYTPAGVRKALSLYEGASVHIDHPLDSLGRVDPPRQRTADSKFGQLRNVRVEGNGLRADLHYLQSHPMAGRVAEAAERMPNAFGLSHNIEYTGRTDRDGTLIVESIDRVRTIDLVPNPATTKSLFESETDSDPNHNHKPKPRTGGAAVPFTVGRYLDRIAKKLGPNKRKRLRGFLLEMDEMGEISDAPVLDDDMAPMEEDVGDEMLEDESKSAEEHLADGFESALIALIRDDGLSPEEKKERVIQLLDAHYELTVNPNSDEVGEPPVNNQVTDETGTYESAIEVVRQLELSGVPVTASLVESCRGMDGRRVKCLVESLGGTSSFRTPVRGNGGSPTPVAKKKGTATESTNPEEERKAFLQSLRGIRTTSNIPEVN